MLKSDSLEVLNEILIYLNKAKVKTLYSSLLLQTFN